MLTFKTIFAFIAILALSVSANRKPKTHKIMVGGAAGLVYTPNRVYAKPGDTVEWHFMFKNHTVTSSAFNTPCTPDGDFTSGFKPVAMDASAADLPKFSIVVEDTDPIWFHCEQIGHCPMGMVGAINPPRVGNTLNQFIRKAKALAPKTAKPKTKGNPKSKSGKTKSKSKSGKSSQGQKGSRSYPVQIDREEEDLE